MELAGTGKVFDDAAAFHALVAVAHGKGETADVKGNAPGDGGHEDDRAKEGEEGADVVAQEFFAFADGKGADGGEDGGLGRIGIGGMRTNPTPSVPMKKAFAFFMGALCPSPTGGGG